MSMKNNMFLSVSDPACTKNILTAVRDGGKKAYAFYKSGDFTSAIAEATKAFKLLVGIPYSAEQQDLGAALKTAVCNPQVLREAADLLVSICELLASCYLGSVAKKDAFNQKDALYSSSKKACSQAVDVLGVIIEINATSKTSSAASLAEFVKHYHQAAVTSKKIGDLDKSCEYISQALKFCIQGGASMDFIVIGNIFSFVCSLHGPSLINESSSTSSKSHTTAITTAVTMSTTATSLSVERAKQCSSLYLSQIDKINGICVTDTHFCKMIVLHLVSLGGFYFERNALDDAAKTCALAIAPLDSMSADGSSAAIVSKNMLLREIFLGMTNCYEKIASWYHSQNTQAYSSACLEQVAETIAPYRRVVTQVAAINDRCDGYKDFLRCAVVIKHFIGMFDQTTNVRKEAEEYLPLVAVATKFILARSRSVDDDILCADSLRKVALFYLNQTRVDDAKKIAADAIAIFFKHDKRLGTEHLIIYMKTLCLAFAICNEKNAQQEATNYYHDLLLVFNRCKKAFHKDGKSISEEVLELVVDKMVRVVTDSVSSGNNACAINAYSTGIQEIVAWSERKKDNVVHCGYALYERFIDLLKRFKDIYDRASANKFSANELKALVDLYKSAVKLFAKISHDGHRDYHLENSIAVFDSAADAFFSLDEFNDAANFFSRAINIYLDSNANLDNPGTDEKSKRQIKKFCKWNNCLEACYSKVSYSEGIEIVPTCKRAVDACIGAYAKGRMPSLEMQFQTAIAACSMNLAYVLGKQKDMDLAAHYSNWAINFLRSKKTVGQDIGELGYEIMVGGISALGQIYSRKRQFLELEKLWEIVAADIFTTAHYKTLSNKSRGYLADILAESLDGCLRQAKETTADKLPAYAEIIDLCICKTAFFPAENALNVAGSIRRAADVLYTNKKFSTAIFWYCNAACLIQRSKKQSSEAAGALHKSSQQILACISHLDRSTLESIFPENNEEFASLFSGLMHQIDNSATADAKRMMLHWSYKRAKGNKIIVDCVGDNSANTMQYEAVIANLEAVSNKTNCERIELIHFYQRMMQTIAEQGNLSWPGCVTFFSMHLQDKKYTSPSKRAAVAKLWQLAQVVTQHCAQLDCIKMVDACVICDDVGFVLCHMSRFCDRFSREFFDFSQEFISKMDDSGCAATCAVISSSSPCSGSGLTDYVDKVCGMLRNLFYTNIDDSIVDMKLLLNIVNNLVKTIVNFRDVSGHPFAKFLRDKENYARFEEKISVIIADPFAQNHGQGVHQKLCH